MNHRPNRGQVTQQPTTNKLLILINAQIPQFKLSNRHFTLHGSHLQCNLEEAARPVSFADFHKGNMYSLIHNIEDQFLKTVV
jgi:hypothetical protein